VPVENAEGAWYRDLLRADIGDAQEVSGWDPDSMPPAQKPAFDQLVFDENGRVWVIQAGPGFRLPGCNEHASEGAEFRGDPCWNESVLADVFDEEGRYLGAVQMPEELSGLDPRILRPRPYIRDDMVIIAAEDELGTIRVKRYRLELPGR
jgi:hypothetical protein